MIKLLINKIIKNIKDLSSFLKPLYVTEIESKNFFYCFLIKVNFDNIYFDKYELV